MWHGDCVIIVADLRETTAIIIIILLLLHFLPDLKKKGVSCCFSCNLNWNLNSQTLNIYSTLATVMLDQHLTGAWFINWQVELIQQFFNLIYVNTMFMFMNFDCKTSKY